jgi:hypothetical protein
MTEESAGWRAAPVYDGGPGFTPWAAGRAYIAKHGHPPIDCPNPKIMAGIRGLYRCPCCGQKCRTASQEERMLNRRARPTRLMWSAWDGSRMAWRVVTQTLAGLDGRAARVFGGVLMAAGLLGYLSVEGWLPR